ncbi:NmrA family NAD(P)-binding protein [Actinacidiphila rubida]|uniref:Uncharacterized conserved protein YbjT, contains NAD(P)-binding and DUF2867 domains n=1 Tax=Actinacidiphila rubida TaxID=310780 RepID=A0A1H8QNN9_9ACTN|nr:NmrA family NAD(P)-binding protein [Actinacidiphila rubida]SEO55608.1 Uncharacterized conserved protein YbjT, contains NAD(P)-binding and DUF2867 domains [Actinacidiphila rubida]
MPASGPILITGATGQSGRPTAQLLLERGHHVRALVHTEDARSRDLANAGAEVLVGDLQDLQSTGAALSGVRSAYFVYPVEMGLVQATSLFALAAAEAGVEGVVNMSQMPARRDAVSNAMRDHWISERVLDWSPVPVTHLRPTLFAEWLTIEPRSVADQGVLRLPMGNGRHAPIAAIDIAHVVAAILENPQGYGGKTYTLTGPVELDHTEIAEIMSDALGRVITYSPMSDADFAHALESQGRSPHLIQHLTNVVRDYREGRFKGVSDSVESIGRIQPTSVGDFVRGNLQLFAAASV